MEPAPPPPLPRRPNDDRTVLGAAADSVAGPAPAGGTRPGAETDTGIASGPAAAQAAPAAPGAPPPRIARYQVRRELGRGGMGVVYLAADPELRRDVALKVLPGIMNADPERVTRFEREAAAAAKLAHPGIVAIHDVGIAGGVHYFTMEYVPGGSLADRIRAAGRLAPMEALRLLREVADAVAYAHGQGIIHRDLKPENILLAGGDPVRPKVSDFGLARVLSDEGAARLTGSHAVLGTPAHMAPEQAAGDTEAVDAQSDVYSLGSVLYEALTGSTPYRGRTSKELWLRKLTVEPTAPRTLVPNLAADIETILQKALERDKARRYASARDFAGDLGRCLAGEAILARPASRLYRARRWFTRNRELAVVCLGLLVAIVAFALALHGPTFLRVVSEPAGARIKIDGRDTGAVTPAERLWVWPAVPVTVAVEKDGFVAQEQRARGQPMRRALVTFSLQAKDAAAPDAARSAVASTLAAVALLRLGAVHEAEAERHLREALAADPLASEATLYRYRDEVPAAERDGLARLAARVAGSWAGRDGVAPGALGMAWLLAGDGARAEEALGRALDAAGPGAAAAAWHLHRARARELAGRASAARADAECARTDAALAPRADELIRRLK